VRRDDLHPPPSPSISIRMPAAAAPLAPGYYHSRRPAGKPHPPRAGADRVDRSARLSDKDSLDETFAGRAIGGRRGPLAAPTGERGSMHKAILSVLGRDRPGIVAAVARTLFDQGCNIENVSQTMLQSEFAGIFIVSLPPGLTTDELHASLDSRLGLLGLRVHTKPCEPPAPEENGGAPGAEPFVITNLQAVFKGGSAPGDNIMIYEVDVPRSIDVQAFTAELRAKAAALTLDLSIQHRNIFKALHRI
jgi:glycine cleavage system transcriptional repressor